MAVAAVSACSKDSPVDPGSGLIPTSCPGLNLGPAPTKLTVPQATPAQLRVLGNGLDTVRYQGEVAVRGNIAYTTSWSVRRV
ncbi:MAG: hypothetical protein ACREBE_05625, partial [bacterium]